MTAPLALGLVGYGMAGRVIHTPLIAAADGVTLTAVASARTTETAADLAERGLRSVDVVGSLDQLLGRDDIDGIVIATPPRLHYTQVRAALDAGKHVVVEKPFTVTSAEAQSLTEHAAGVGRVLSVFHQRRWDSDFRTLWSVIESGQIGEVVSYRLTWNRYRPQMKGGWRDRGGEPGAGVLSDLGTHMADQVLSLLGPPRSVWGQLMHRRPGAQVNDECLIVMSYRGCEAILSAGMLRAGPEPRLVVHGTKGSFVKYGLDPQEEALKAGTWPGSANWGLEPQTRWADVTTSDNEGELITQKRESVAGNWPAFYEAFARCVRGEGPNPVSGEDGLATIRVIGRAYEASRTGAAVAFD